MRLKAADLAQLAEDGSWVRVRHERLDVLVANSGGDLYAIDNRCSHANMPMHKGRIRKCVVTCPSHLAQFDLRDGSIRRGPMEGDPENVRPQAVFAVEIEGGEVFIEVPGE
ncbi:Rieske (2Fe-2S) protein [Amycolatopsis jejuensis]|uniref:Rieske (2Fe-2S) protein n=1 Tax=Amycolatopsis jejuensis TaxID=330084 RepID=UPI000527D36B|nr:Rieske 2Fe-2S domain-containing protein [Amycolatopsis jejuensis]